MYTVSVSIDYGGFLIRSYLSTFKGAATKYSRYKTSSECSTVVAQVLMAQKKRIHRFQKTYHLITYETKLKHSA